MTRRSNQLARRYRATALPPILPTSSESSALSTSTAIARAGPSRDAAVRNPTNATSVVTRILFAVGSERAWERLVFFEEIERRLPLHLRFLLPRPIGIEGRKASVGDEAICRYVRGHLRKRVVEVERGRLHRFEIVEQDLGFGGGVTLVGGGYRLNPLSGRCTEVLLETRYVGARRPRWFWRPIEASFCHGFHRFILRAMRDRVATL
jgi:hypothetical protein